MSRTSPLRSFAVRGTVEESEELRRGRAHVNQKLRSRFERIFDKYDKPFEGIGDEIDLATGAVVVNNGHLENMQHERDTGPTHSHRFVRAFTQELGGEDHSESRARSSLRLPSQAPGPDLQQSPYRQGHSQMRTGGQDTRLLAHTPLQPPPLPGLSALIPALQSSNGRVDPDAILSLSSNLASQIANYLSQQIRSQLAVPQNNSMTTDAYLNDANGLPLGHRLESGSLPLGLQSPTPAPDLSLWALDRRRRGPRQAQDISQDHDSMDMDLHDVIASVEYHGQDDEYTIPEYGIGLKSGSTLRSSLKFEGFLSQATYNFQTLAHGYANRGALDEKETKREAKRRAQRIAEAQAEAAFEGELTSIRRLNHSKQYSLEEDRLIIRLKKQNLAASEITRYLPGRSTNSIAVRYARALKEGSLRYNQSRVQELPNDYDENIDPALQLLDGHPQAGVKRKRKRLADALEAGPDRSQSASLGPIIADDSLRAKGKVSASGTPAVPVAKKPRKQIRKTGFVNFDASCFMSDRDDSPIPTAPSPEPHRPEQHSPSRSLLQQSDVGVNDQPSEQRFRNNPFVMVNQDLTQQAQQFREIPQAQRNQRTPQGTAASRKRKAPPEPDDPVIDLCAPDPFLHLDTRTGRRSNPASVAKAKTPASARTHQPKKYAWKVYKAPTDGTEPSWSASPPRAEPSVATPSAQGQPQMLSHARRAKPARGASPPRRTQPSVVISSPKRAHAPRVGNTTQANSPVSRPPPIRLTGTPRRPQSSPAKASATPNVSNPTIKDELDSGTEDEHETTIYPSPRRSIYPSPRQPIYPSPKRGSDYSMMSSAYAFPIDPALASEFAPVSHHRSIATTQIPQTALPNARPQGLPAWGKVPLNRDVQRVHKPKPGSGLRFQPLSELIASSRGTTPSSSAGHASPSSHGERSLSLTPGHRAFSQRSTSVHSKPVRSSMSTHMLSSPANSRQTSENSSGFGGRLAPFDVDASDDDL